jgi:hypothetical protein
VVDLTLESCLFALLVARGLEKLSLILLHESLARTACGRTKLLKQPLRSKLELVLIYLVATQSNKNSFTAKGKEKHIYFQ